MISSGPEIFRQVASEFQGEVDAILLGASLHAVGSALGWARVLAMLRTGSRKPSKTQSDGRPRTTPPSASAGTGICNIAITACARSSQASNRANSGV